MDKSIEEKCIWIMWLYLLTEKYFKVIVAKLNLAMVLS